MIIDVLPYEELIVDKCDLQVLISLSTIYWIVLHANCDIILGNAMDQVVI